jgi:hypothetical protein
VDLSESLKDFVTLKYRFSLFFGIEIILFINRFEPPGMISAGMSCYLYVTFEPKVNKSYIVLYSG